MAHPSPVILISTPELVAGCLGDLYIEVIRGRFDLRILRLSCDVQVKAGKQAPHGKVAALSILHQNVTLPDSDARQATDETIATLAPYTKASAMSLLAKGFTASIMRSLMVGANVVSKTPFPTKVASNIQEGCAFLLAHVEAVKTVEEMVAIAEGINAIVPKATG